MGKPIVSKRKGDAISNGLFLVSLGGLFYFNFWWPGILLSIWILLAVRQYLAGRHFDLVLSSIVLLGLFIVTLFNINFATLMPALFILGGIYIILREYFYREDKEDPYDKDEPSN